METIFLVEVEVFKKNPIREEEGKDEKEDRILDNRYIGLTYLGHSHFWRAR